MVTKPYFYARIPFSRIIRYLFKIYRMKSSPYFALIAFLAMIHIGMPLKAQYPIQPEPPFIEINGIAEKEIVPDRIYLGILIRERISGKDKITVAQQEEKLKSGLKRKGIALENLYLSDANANYYNRPWKNREVISQTQYELRVSNATEVSEVFSLLDEIEITDAWIAKVDHSKMEELKKDLRIEAIKAAKAKSDYLLGAISQQTGKALIVRENEYYQQPVYYNKMANTRMDMMESAGAAAPEYNPIDFRKIKIQASVYVKFEVK